MMIFLHFYIQVESEFYLESFRGRFEQWLPRGEGLCPELDFTSIAISLWIIIIAVVKI